MAGNKILVLLLSFLILQSCTHKLTIIPVPSSDQMIDHKNVVTSELKHVVSLSQYEKTKVEEGRLMFLIVVENYGENPINISNNNISVSFEANNQKRDLIKVGIVSPSEFTQNIAMEYVNPPKFTDFLGDVSGSSTGRSLTDSGFGNSGGVADNTEQMKASMKRTEVISHNVRAERLFGRRENLKYSLPRTILKPRIIMPDDSITAIFACNTSEIDKKTEGTFHVTVSIENENHEFTFSRSFK